MAPLPPNTTARLFVDYTTCKHQHTIVCRYDAPNTPADAMDAVSSLWTALDTFIYLATVDGARFQEAGSDVSVDVAWTGDPTYGDENGPEEASAWFVDYVGRSLGGRRVRVSTFGFKLVSYEHIYRVQTGDIAAVDAGQAALDAAEGAFLAIDGGEPIWKTYANIGANAYWRNKIR